MSKIIKQLTKYLRSSTNPLTDEEVELWASLYIATRRQQSFAVAVMSLLENSNQSDLIKQAKEIIALDTLLRKNHGTLLEKIDKCQNQSLKKQLFTLL
ncbi:hypothetical protein BKK49_06975 [Rodentibacter rarus]|uniref:hypothetical protein n=1 Tax=Rodentibacter rarus TaxID=1908260 RepID=UPI000986C909|nr:hypothetical protein [Rodentibacter rarus]OOF39862.1 hypothetical protein BKK49_06975 [Rodentibacter rarus]